MPKKSRAIESTDYRDLEGAEGGGGSKKLPFVPAAPFGLPEASPSKLVDFEAEDDLLPPPPPIEILNVSPGLREKSRPGAGWCGDLPGAPCWGASGFGGICRLTAVIDLVSGHYFSAWIAIARPTLPSLCKSSLT